MITNLIQLHLQHPAISKKLSNYDINNPSTAELKMIITINFNTQKTTKYELQHELNLLDVVFEAPSIITLLLTPDEFADTTHNHIKNKQFYIIKIKSIKNTADDNLATTMLTSNNNNCHMETTKLTRVTRLITVTNNNNPRTKPTKQHYKLLSKLLTPDNVLLTNIKPRPVTTNTSLYNIKYKPRLQNTIITITNNTIKTIINNYNNNNFNHVITTRHQFGSTFKPLLYLTTLQLN